MSAEEGSERKRDREDGSGSTENVNPPPSTYAETFLGMSAREAKFAGREMPQDFHTMLGEYEHPEEAKDLEEIVMGHCDFEDLPQSRKDSLLVAATNLAGKCKLGLTDREAAHLYRRASHMPGCKDGVARKSELTAAYRHLVREGKLAPNEAVEEVLIKKRGKSHSGVLVVTVFMGPGEFSCPKDCHYCPNQPGIARSYLLKEPGVLRGFRNGWDPIRQFFDRANALENNGHIVDKIELIILGGTFSFYPKDYVEEFMKASFYAANTYYDSKPFRPMQSLQEEITINESARCRIIGVTAETRPDYITNTELKRFRQLGITRVQLGIQHLDDDILEYINRDCPTAKTVTAIQKLLDAGFKVDAHWMPDLPGSSFEKDLEMFQFLLSDENELFQVDQWKVYPTATVPFTKIKEWYEEGKYKPYANDEGGKYMVDLLMYILQNVPHRIRLNRIIRDIPTTYISGGERRVNLRQLLEREMKTKGLKCNDIRERECKGKPITKSESRIFVDRFVSSGGTEYYISIEDEQRSNLFGHLRLRLRDERGVQGGIFPALYGAALIRELHTYGKLVAVSTTNTGKETQHVGVGTQLMRKAEEIARENGFTKSAVIAGVGVRKYYEKLGYHLEDTYMVRSLSQEAPSHASSTPSNAHQTSAGDTPEEDVTPTILAVAQGTVTSARSKIASAFASLKSAVFSGN